MADFYDTGTITATNGSAAVTGSGTSWALAGVKSGDLMFIFESAGPVPYLINGTPTATAIMLTSNYQGSTAAGKAYAIMRRYDEEKAADVYRLLNEYITALNDADKVATDTVAAASKNPPIDADSFPIVDSADSNALKQITFANLWTWVMAKIAAVATKATPIDADGIAIVDSAASDVTKRVLFSALWTWVQAKVAGATAKTTPIAGDLFYLVDTAAANVAKVLTYANLKKNVLAWTYATSQPTTSGITFDFTSIPSGVEEIEIWFDGCSLSGTDDFLVQIGDSDGLETSGYLSASDSNNTTANSTAGFIVDISTAANAANGVMRLSRASADGLSWVSSHAIRTGNIAVAGGGTKTLTAELDRVRLLATGANTFDAGAVSIRYR